MSTFEKKVAIITGGGSGIGRAAAEELARRGASVIVACRTAKNGQAVADAIQAAGATAAFVQTDVREEAQIRHLIEETIRLFGRLDMAFNNAGIEQPPLPLPEQPVELYQDIMDTNVKGVWLCMKHQIPAMLKNGGGAIVNTSSICGTIAFPKIPLYVASKHAVIGLTKSVALEYVRQNIRVNAILPGITEGTGFYDRSYGADPILTRWARSLHPLNRLATPQEIAAAAIYLLSPESSFITWQALPVDGGYTAS